MFARPHIPRSAPTNKQIPRKPIDSLIVWLLSAMKLAQWRLFTPQQKKRNIELSNKLSAIPLPPKPRPSEVYELNLLATHPDYQGKGFGTALGSFVTSIVSQAISILGSTADM
jgi:GNAT superfamily N-acetyltransferase